MILSSQDLGNCTESALLKVTNDIMLATDTRSAVAMVLLDLSSAFDMVDHSTLIIRLKNLGIHGTVSFFI